MKFTVVILIIGLSLTTTSVARHKRKVKRFGESLTSLPYLPNQQQSFSFDNGISIPKSNIPFTPPSLLNTIPANDDNSPEIPLGPLVQTDSSDKVDGDVHLKDLLSFIRKTNIPEDPFASSESADLLPSPQHEPVAQAPIMVPIQRRFNVPGLQGLRGLGLMAQRKRFFMQQSGIPVDRYTQPFSLQSIAYERKNVIPHGPAQNSMIQTPANIALTVQKSSIPRPAQIVDPYEGLRQAIIRKAATDTKPRKTKRNLYKSVLPNTGSSTMVDPYEHLRRAISVQEAKLHEQDVERKKEQIPNAAQEEKSIPYVAQGTKATYPFNYEQERKADIPGITIEHEAFSNKENDNVRKDIIPEGDKTKESAVGDANNEPESKRSIFTQEPFTNIRRSSVIPVNGQIETMQQEALNGPDQQDPLSTTNAQLAIDSQFVTKSNIPEQSQQYNQAYTVPVSMYMTSNQEPEVQLRSAITNEEQTEIDNKELQKTNTTLPSGMELERTKIQREMHLIGQLQNMKKSTIPHAQTYDTRSNILTQSYEYSNRQTNQQYNLPQYQNSYQIPSVPQITKENTETKNEERKSNIQLPVVHDSTPLVLHVRPAEGMANLMSSNKPVDPPSQLIMKKSNIPEQVADSTNGLYKATEAAETSTPLPHQMNFEEEMPVKKSETSSQGSLVMTPNEKKSTIPIYNIYNQPNGELVDEEPSQQLQQQQSNQIASNTQENIEVKKDVMPLVPDSYPLRLRKLPPS